MLNKARKWFTNHGIGLGAVRSYNGAIDGLDWIGYKAYGADGEVAGIVSLDELRIGVSITKPLLVISFPFTLTARQFDVIKRAIGERLMEHGWMAAILDAQPERRVEAFGVDSERMESMSLDSIIELLEALKRVREGAVHGGIGVANT